jgi:peptidoglycan/LPS O-acetylase OafA/YrhL
VNVRADRFPLFDSLRAIAFLSVMVTHAAVFAGIEDGDAFLAPYVARLDVGVQIFFVISGFLLYRPFVAAALRGEEPPASGPYAWRRFLRVAPPYWLALTVTAIWLGFTGIFSLDHAPLYYGFAHIYSGETLGYAPMPQAWSLCVEVAFYAFLPLYALLMRRLPARGVGARLRLELAGAAALLLVSGVYKLWLLGRGPATEPSLLGWHLAFPESLDYFAIGIALAALSAAYAQRDELPRPLRAIERYPSLAWGAAFAAFVVASRGIGFTGRLDDTLPDARYLERHYLYAAIALCLLLPAVFGDHRRGVVRRLLANRGLLWLGVVSYGAFLFHFAVLIQLERWDFAEVATGAARYLWFPAVLAGTVVIAAVSWYGFERPVLRLRRLFPARAAGRGEAAPEPAIAPPRAG